MRLSLWSPLALKQTTHSVHTSRLTQQLEKSKCKLCEGALHLQECNARSVIIKSANGKIVGFEHQGEHHHEKPGMKRGGDMQTIDTQAIAPPGVPTHGDAVVPDYPTQGDAVPGYPSLPAAKRARTDDSHGGGLLAAYPPVPNADAVTRPPLLSPSLLYDTFFGRQEKTTEVPMRGNQTHHPALLKASELSNGAELHMHLDQALPQTALQMNGGLQSAVAPPWAELDHFLGESCVPQAGRILYELGVTTSARLVAHDPECALIPFALTVAS